MLDHLIASSHEYPTFTAAMNVATTAGAASLAGILTRGSAAGAAAKGGVLGRVIGAVGDGATRMLTTGAFATSMLAAGFITAAPLAAAGGVAAAGAAGYGAGSLLYKMIEETSFSDAIGRSIAVAMAAMGNKNAREPRDSERDQAPLQVHVKVTRDSAHLTAEVNSQQQRQAMRR